MNRKVILITVLLILTFIGGLAQTKRNTSKSKSNSKSNTTVKDNSGTKSAVPMTSSPIPTPVPTPIPTPEPPSLDQIVSEAEKQTVNYQNTFKDLLATETKTFEKFDKNGSTKDQTVIESEFLVYQSAKEASITTEFRNILKVDGKPIPDSQSRSQRFLAELQKANSVVNELDKIQKEGARYDKTLEIGGLTLFEGGVLPEKVRPYFDFKLLSTENFQGNEVFVVSYQQTKKSPYVILNGKDTDVIEESFSFKLDVPDSLKNSDAFLRGKLWIDSKTFQIRREERELTVQSDTPLVLMANDFVYQTSDYGILVPKQISLTENILKKGKDSGKYEAVKDIRVNYDYSKFRKANTDVKILDDNN